MPGRGEVQMKTRVLVEPCRHLGMLVGGIVVEHEMEIEFWRSVAVDGSQEAQELLMPVALHALADHRPGGDIEGGEQRGRAMALIIMGHGAGTALLHRQPRRGAVERLDLALLVDAQHHRLVWGAQVEADDILDFLDKSLVIGQLETAHKMRLEPVCVPNPPHTGLAEADGLVDFSGMPPGKWTPFPRPLAY